MVKALENEVRQIAEELEIAKQKRDLMEDNFNVTTHNVYSLEKTRKSIADDKQKFSEKIQQLDAKITDMANVQKNLKEQNTKLERDRQELLATKNEVQKMYNDKRLQYDSLQKISEEKVKNLEF